MMHSLAIWHLDFYLSLSFVSYCEHSCMNFYMNLFSHQSVPKTSLMAYIETSFQSCLPFCISPSDIQRFQFFHIFFGHFVLHETVDVAIILKINYPTYVIPLSLACKQHWTMIHLFAFYFSMVFFFDRLLWGKTYKVSRLWIWKRSVKRGRCMQFSAAYLWVAGAIMTAYSRYSHGFS